MTYWAWAKQARKGNNGAQEEWWEWERRRRELLSIRPQNNICLAHIIWLLQALKSALYAQYIIMKGIITIE